MVNEKVKSIYCAQEIRFPIIGMVIDGNIDGVILLNDEIEPTHVFVVHKFGFCQEMYTEYDQQFLDEQIIPFIQNSKEKLRLYNPQGKLVEYLEKLSAAVVAKRMHYLFSGKCENKIENSNYMIRPMTIEDLEKENFGMDLSSRYYRGAEDFIANAMPFVAVSKENDYMALIYSAGSDGYMCEIDSFTKEEYRNLGIGKHLIQSLAFECERQGKRATIDCYSNLVPSRKFAEHNGFELVKEYDFYNIKQ